MRGSFRLGLADPKQEAQLGLPGALLVLAVLPRLGLRQAVAALELADGKGFS